VTESVLELVSAFEGLEPPPASGLDLRFSAVPIQGFEAHRIGKDTQGLPSLLISTDSRANTWPAPIVLPNLSVQHDVDCRILRPGGDPEAGRFTLLRCTTSERTLRAYFLHVGATLVELLGNTPSDSDVSTAVSRLVQLFRAMGAAPRKSVQGLWAELLLIARASDPRSLVRSWHVMPADRYDFSQGPDRIEVKSASGRIRQHHFSLDQVAAIEGTRVLIASLLVERAGAGASLGDLIEEVKALVGGDPGLLLHVDEIVIGTLGDEWEAGLRDSFDRHLAENSLAFFSSGTIPRVDACVPPEVSDVRFRADLSNIPPFDPSDQLFSSVLLHAATHR
jgi:Putative  PD-(D/E)XK family member, (DUF4420)